LGHPGHGDAQDVKRAKQPGAKSNPFRVVRKNLSQTVRDSWNKSTRSTRTGRFVQNRELSSRKSGPKGR
ncbi:hypothetical protein KI387_011309, partial [Taxus chinensis]